MLSKQVEKELRKEVDEDKDSDSSEEEETSEESEDSEDSEDDGLLEEVVSELRQQVESSMSLSDKDKSVLKFLDERKEQTEQRLSSAAPDAVKEVKAADRTVTMKELKEHGRREDAWLAVNGSVYNVTQYLDLHPGGWDEMIKGVGRDATDLFNEKHKWVDYQEILEGKLVGRLVSPSHE